MTRVDKPALRCDRCAEVTEDTSEMAKFSRLYYPHMGGEDQWDLCPTCWAWFIDQVL